MKAGKIYEMIIRNVEDQLLIARIYDNSVMIEDADTEDIVPVEGAGTPIVLQTNNNGRDKFSPIYGSSLVLTVRSTENFYIGLLMVGELSATRYYVTLEVNNTGAFIFKGYLSLSDMKEPFQPHSLDIVLTATDRLGILSNKTLLDLNGANPTGKYRIADLVAFCLARTGLSLPINVISNLREESGGINPEDNWFNRIYIDSKTFEKEIGESQDCETVLKAILQYDAFIAQRNGEWWIKRVDEFDVQPDTVNRYAANGQFLGTLPAEFYNQAIGINEKIFFSNESCGIEFYEPNELAKLTFNFSLPKESVCNIDFDRGALSSVISPAEKRYEIDCWQLFKANYPSSDLVSPTTQAYIRREFVNDYENNRYVVIDTAAQPSNCLVSEGVSVQHLDKFKLSISRRLSATISGSGSITDIVAQVRLYGNDGSHWTLFGGLSTDPDPRWVACNASFTNNQQNISAQYDASVDETEDVSVTVDAPAIPVTGYIRILLYQSGLYGATRLTYFPPISFEYIPFINGSYQKFTGQSKKVQGSQDNGLKVDDSVNISDSPNPAYKGSLLIRQIGGDIYTGSVDFIAPNTIKITNDARLNFFEGREISISGANAGVYRIIKSIYHVIGDYTEIIVQGSAWITATENITVKEIVYPLAGRFYNASVFPAGVPNASYLHPFGELQAFAVWNQYKRLVRIFSSQIQGIRSDEVDGSNRPYIPSHLHTYVLTDPSIYTNDRLFMLVSLNIDLYLCEGQIVLNEVLDKYAGKAYDDPFEAKYVTS